MEKEYAALADREKTGSVASDIRVKLKAFESEWLPYLNQVCGGQ